MASLNDMIARIQDELIHEDLSTDQISREIRSTIAFYERREFWFNRRFASFQTTAGKEYYGIVDLHDLPDIVRIAAATSELSGNRLPMEGRDHAWVNANQNGAVTGRPLYYSTYENSLRLWPIPDDVYTVAMRYVYRLDQLDGEDANAWTTEAEELIRSQAKTRIAVNILHASDMANGPAALGVTNYNELKAETRRRNPNVTLRTEIAVAAPYNIRTG